MILPKLLLLPLTKIIVLMKNTTIFFSAIGFLLVAVAGCKEKDTILEIETEMPSIAVVAEGHTITDGVIHLPVIQESTIIGYLFRS